MVFPSIICKSLHQFDQQQYLHRALKMLSSNFLLSSIYSWKHPSIHFGVADKNPLFAESFLLWIWLPNSPPVSFCFHHFILRPLILLESQIVFTDGVADRKYVCSGV